MESLTKTPRNGEKGPIVENAKSRSDVGLLRKLSEMQRVLKVPKSNFNSFGGYSYRSAEDILEAVKPLLHERGTVLTLSDDVVEKGGRSYVMATATLHDLDSGSSISTSALAREEESKRGMAASQMTGTASSYARKYALGGMFAIDDGKDPDATNDHGKGEASSGGRERGRAAWRRFCDLERNRGRERKELKSEFNALRISMFGADRNPLEYSEDDWKRLENAF